MSNEVIQVDSGTQRAILEQSPLPVEEFRAQEQDQGRCTGCVPFPILDTLVEFQVVPAECLPLPLGATVACPEIAVICTTGTPEPLGPGLIGVAESLTVLAHPISILAPNGAVVCTLQIEEVTFRPSLERIVCPTTEGVTCTCSIGPILCEGCTFETFDGVLEVRCQFRFVETIECLACTPVRGLTRVSTPL